MDYLKHAVQIINDFRVPEAQNAVPLLLEPPRSVRIAFGDGGVGMLRSIQLDHKPRGHTGEVDHIGADGRLATEMGALHGKTFQRPPQLPFRRGFPCTKLAGPTATEG